MAATEIKKIMMISILGITAVKRRNAVSRAPARRF